ncbi:MAG: metal-dependent transcriptional regulator [Suipraeoptans sp.]
MKMTESVENYLETILMLNMQKPNVRAIDIVDELGFKKSSVSVAMKNLRENVYILVSEDGFITLTSKGREIGEMIYERHEAISNWLTDLGVDKDIALADACKIEHALSPESFTAIKKHIQNSK